jgi:phage/plasmid-like protein (TIGR03299 family)
MSRETAQWLNTMTLIGDADKRGKAWHYRAEAQGDESNHYDGPVPVEDIRRRLIDWQAAPRRIAVELPADMATMTHIGSEGQPLRWAVMEDRQAIARSDTDYVMGLFKSGYVPHQYDQWLIKNIETILDDQLHVSSAGLLRGGGVMWVEVSVPDNITTPEGVVFRPNLLAATSFDGSLATTLKRTIQMVVCDNTLEVAKSEDGDQIKIKHSRNSIGRIGDIREALGIVYAAADDFAAEVAALTQQEVTDAQWSDILTRLVPIDEEKDGKRKINNAEKKRGELNQLYNFDTRVADYTGTAFGVLQAFNTHMHHFTRGTDAVKAQRNMLAAVEGTGARQDQKVLDAMALVLAK